jgi:spermidine/putrescine transport system permease protein
MKARLPRWVTACALLTLAFLYLPMLAVAVFSLNASRYGMVWRGFTLQWYGRLLRNADIWEAARNTLVLAVVSTAIATVLGTLLAIGMARYPWKRATRGALDLLVYLPVVTPDIIFAAAVVVAFKLLEPLYQGFRPGLLDMVLSHVTFQIAFVAIVVHSRLVTLGGTLEEAARDLYSRPPYLLRRVTLPLLAPGVVAGAMLAFTLSLDDFVISFFTAGPHSTTLPLYIFGQVHRGVTPEVHALSTLVFLVTVLLVVGTGVLARYRRS